jgi:hypothetical protein
MILKLHDVQFWDTVRATLEPFTAYRWYIHSDEVRRPDSTQMLKAIVASKEFSD